MQLKTVRHELKEAYNGLGLKSFSKVSSQKARAKLVE